MTSPPPTRSTNSAPAVLLGSETPRLWTPPLRELTPATSYGFDLVDFAFVVLGIDFYPWQKWLSIHAGELLPDGRPRFRRLLVMVARQNGKSLWAKVLILYWLFIEMQRKVLATSTNRDYARVAWYETLDMIKETEWLAGRLNVRKTAFATGSEVITTTDGCQYKFAASNRRTGRSLTLNRVLLDELREHLNFAAWDAVTPTQKTLPDAQLVALSNAGGPEAVVLNQFRSEALAGDNERLGLFEWSAPPDADPDDPDMLAMANPLVGHIPGLLDELIADARAALAAGGEKLAGFMIEQLCVAVPGLNPAVDMTAWDADGTDHPVDLAQHRKRVAACVDVSLDGKHATLVAAAEIDGVVHVDVVAAWHDLTDLRRELPAWVAKMRPRVFGWFPNGPAAALAADLTADRGRRGTWPPRGVHVDEIKTELTAACMGVAQTIRAGQIRHAKDPLLTAQLQAVQRLKRGDAWVFSRAGGGQADAAYALAGAVWLARTLPAPRPPLAVA